MANIEAIVIEWLDVLMGSPNDWPVSGDKPKTPPEQYILVDRTGGPREFMSTLDRAEILIEVFHKTSRSAASNKADEIGDAINGLLAYENITRAKINSIVNLDDLLGQFHRYQIFVDVYHRR